MGRHIDSYSDDVPPGSFIILLLIVFAVCILGMVKGCVMARDESDRRECVGDYDNLDCRIAKQIREDLQQEYELAKKKYVEAGGQITK